MADEPQAAANTTTINSGNYPAIDADTYWITAQKQLGTAGSGDGCVTSAVSVIITDITQDPAFAISNVNPNTACTNDDASAVDGTFTITPSDPSAPAIVTDFNIDFDPAVLAYYAVGAPPAELGITNVVANGADLALTGLAPGQYDFTITSNGTFCAVAGIFTVPDNPVRG